MTFGFLRALGVAAALALFALPASALPSIRMAGTANIAAAETVGYRGSRYNSYYRGYYYYPGYRWQSGHGYRYRPYGYNQSYYFPPFSYDPNYDPFYEPYGYDYAYDDDLSDAPRVAKPYAAGSDAARYCARKYRSYNPRTGKYLTNSGRWKTCVYRG